MQNELSSDTEVPPIGSGSDDDERSSVDDKEFYKYKTPLISEVVLNYDEKELEQRKSGIKSDILELKKSRDQLRKSIEDDEVKKSADETEIYQQIKVANLQLDNVQEKLFHFFDGINKFSDIFADTNNEEKTNKAKEISDHIEQSQTKEISTERKYESFEALSSHANNVIDELTIIMDELYELLDRLE